MDMVITKPIFITLILTILNVNAKNECEYQLKSQGEFNMDYDKTQAFMYAYGKLNFPMNETNSQHLKGILYQYQKELLDKFLIAHKEHLEKMFDHPMNWCIQHLDMYKHWNKSKSDVQNCIDAMNNYSVEDLHVSHEKALVGLFMKLMMQKLYMKYVGFIVEHFVKYTSARSPQNYCNNIESIPEKLIFVNSSGNWEEFENPEYNKSLTSVHQEKHFPLDLINQLASSTGAENTSAKSPENHYHDIDSIPEKSIFINDGRKLEETVNPGYNQSSTSVHQEKHFPLDLNYSLASSSGANETILNFDLNQIPPNNDE